MENNIQITRLTDNDNAIAKQISEDGNKLHKESRASVKDGVVHAAEFSSWENYTDYLTNIPGNECLLLGRFKHGLTARIVGSKELENITKNKYSRSLVNFEWHKDYQLLCIDYDGSKSIDLTPEEVIAIIDVALPGFADITKVVKYSSGAWIHNVEDILLSTSNGFHIYFLIKKPECIAAVFKGSSSILHRKLWLNGHGYIKNSRPKDRRTTAVTQMERSIYDNCIFSPERIIFEAPPILKGSLYKTNKEAFIINGSIECLDISRYEELSDGEIQEYNRLAKVAKEDNEKTPYMIESRLIFQEHVREKVKNGKYKDRKEYIGLNIEEIVKREYEGSRNGLLMQDHVIELASGDCVTVEEILKDPEKYHGQQCYDPHEPEYSTGPIAIIYVNQKVPIIFSQAHGGIKYRLIPGDFKNSGPDFLSKEYWLNHFYLVVYDKKNEIYHIDGNKIVMYSSQGLNSKFSCYLVEVGEGKNCEYVPANKWWMSSRDKKCIDGDGFSPGKPILYEKENGELVFNEYVPEILEYGFDVPTEDEYEQYALPWVNHIRKMIHSPEEAEVVIDWFSYLVNHPDERPMFAVLLLSETRGVGKDMMSDIWAKMMGPKYAKKSTVDTLTKGDGWGDVYYKSKLIVVSECGSSTDRYTIGNNIKDAITTNTMQMNIKCKEQVSGNVYPGIIFYSNNLSPFKFDKGDRRFFVTRCDWTIEQANKIKDDGYFGNLMSFYDEPTHMHGLYHYLLNRVIKTNMKGDAPMTSTKETLMYSEPNNIEQFFNDLKIHPCKYWTKGMIDNLYFKECGSMDINDNLSENKQYKHFIGHMLEIDKKRIKVKGKTVRLKTFTHQDAEMVNDYIRKNIEDNWGKTTDSLHPITEDEGVSSICDVLDCCDDDGIEHDGSDSKEDKDFGLKNFPIKAKPNMHRFEGIII